MPSLKTPSPALYSSTREAAVSHLSQATTYLASFTLAQLALKVSFHPVFVLALTLRCRPLTPAWRLQRVS